MKTALLCIAIFGSTLAYSQRELSQQAMSEMVNKASQFLGLDNNSNVKAALNKYLTTYSRLGGPAAMAALKSDLQGRKDLMMFMERAVADRESLLTTLTAVQVSQKSSQEIADYLFPKNAVARPPVQEVKPLPAETTATKPAEPLVLQPPSKKFFDGRKTFCDSSGTSYYTVIIIKNSVLLTKYQGKPKDKMSSPLSKTKALLSGDNIVLAENHQVNYRYEGNALYEKDDLERWSKYVECSE